MRELFHVSNVPHLEPPNHLGDFALASECFGLRHADETGSLVGRELQCELSFCFSGLALLPLLHRRVPTILCNPHDAVCHGFELHSCPTRPRVWRVIPGSCATNHKAPHLFVSSSLHHLQNRILWLSSWVAPLRAAQAAHPFAPTRRQSPCLNRCVCP